MSPNLRIDSMDRAPSHHKPAIPRASDLPTSPTTVDPIALAAYNRGILRAREVDRTEQARREGWCRACGADRDYTKSALCYKCWREMRAS